MPNAVTLKVEFEGTLEREIEVSAFLFAANGQPLTSAKLKDGIIELPVAAELTKGARLFLGPTPQGVAKRLTVEQMDRIEATEIEWRPDGHQSTFSLGAIPQMRWKLWRFCKCRVHGKVVRPTVIQGELRDLPVYKARVHIVEVDALRLLIKRLPEPELLRIGKELLRELEVVPHPTPHPIPDPSPEFHLDPEIIDPTPENVARLLNPESGVHLPEAVGLRLLRPVLRTPVVRTPRISEPAIAVPRTISPALRTSLASGSVRDARLELLAHPELIRPFLCRWRWLHPYFVLTDEWAVVETNQMGEFETTHFYLCSDQPDLYFHVEYSIGGEWISVYKPSIPCHTHWNYVCGTEVVIKLSDPRVVGTTEPINLPGKVVSVLTIGNAVSIKEIQSTGPNEGLTVGGEPFGGSLEPHVFFGWKDLLAAGISHYRWSWRKLGTATWHAFDRPIVRHYARINGSGNLVFEPLLLGPDPALAGSLLYRIQGQAPVGTLGWAPMVDARTNSASGQLLSYLLEGGNAALAAGKYELKLELFRATAPLTPVNFTDEGISVSIPTLDAPFGTGEVPTVAADDAHVFRQHGKVVAFRLVLHIDNQPCQAQTYDITGTGITAGSCGFLRYVPGAKVHISFRAHHPSHFGWFAFDTVRGTSPVGAATVSAKLGVSPVGGFTRDPSTGIYNQDIAVQWSPVHPATPSLLSAECLTQGAFSEQLRVYAMATDGWSRLSYLDAYSGMRAYALTT